MLEPSSMPFRNISENYFIEAGFLFHRPAKKIIDFTKLTNSKVSNEEFRAISALSNELFNIEDLFKIYEDNDLIPFSAPTIFEQSVKVRREVYVGEKGLCILNYKTPKKYRGLAMQLDVIAVSIYINQKKVTKLFYYRETPEYALEMSQRNTVPNNCSREDGLIFYERNNLNDIDLTEDDLTILKEYSNYKEKMILLSKHLYQKFYDIAYGNFKDDIEMEGVLFINTIKSTSKMTAYELDLSINKFAAILYLLTVFPAFSFSESIEFPTSSKDKLEDLELYYSEISFNLINKGKYKELWNVLLKLSMLNWKQIKDNNKNNNTVFAIPLFQYYRTLKAIKGWLFYSILYYRIVKNTDDLPLNNISNLTKSDYWLQLNKLVAQLSETNLREPYSYEIEPLHSKQMGLKGIYINGKILNVRHIIFLFQTLRSNVDDQLLKLGNYFSGVSFPAFSIKELLKARHGDFNDSTLYDMNQFFEYIPEKYKGKFLTEKKWDFANPNTVLQIIKIIACNLIWMVHISTNCGLHFKDLITLMHSGPDKNIFLNPETNGLRIRFKTRNVEHPNLPPVEFNLDPVTSKYLLHHILVILPILIKYFEGHDTRTTESIIIKLKDKLVNVHPYVVSYENANFFKKIINTFTFIDPITCSLPTRGDFNKVIAKLPVQFSLNELSRLNSVEYETGIRTLARKELLKFTLSANIKEEQEE